MRAALFSPALQEDESFGHLAETAILSQWFHSDGTEDLYYARWKRTGAKKSLGDHGEIDVVCCSKADFKPQWIIEIKWSDTAHDRGETWASVDEFVEKHKMDEAVITSRTRSGKITRNDIDFIIVPTALYCYTVGKNSVKAKSKFSLR